MKTTLLLTLMTVTFLSNAHAGTREKYIENKTGRVVEISNSKEVDASIYSKSTKEEIAGVKAGETILLTTYVNKSSTQTISRYCDVYEVFENKMAQVGCIGFEIDREDRKDAPKRLDFIVTNVEEATPEVQELDGFFKSEVAAINIKTLNANVGRHVRIISIFANGEALVEKTGYSLFNSKGIVNRGTSVDRVHLSDLSKLD